MEISCACIAWRAEIQKIQADSECLPDITLLGSMGQIYLSSMTIMEDVKAHLCLLNHIIWHTQI